MSANFAERNHGNKIFFVNLHFKATSVYAGLCFVREIFYIETSTTE